MRPIMPSTANVVNAMSMFDIGIHLHFINKESSYKKCTPTNQAYPKCMFGKLVRYKVADDCKAQDQFTNIIAIFGKVVYLLLIKHINIKLAIGVPGY